MPLVFLDGLLIGLVIGLVVAAEVHLYHIGRQLDQIGKE
jgi:hypothetical protein